MTPLEITALERRVLIGIAYAVALRRAEPVGECVEYRGEKGAAPPEGRYGKLRLQNGEVVGTHRLAYEYHHGPIPDGLVVRHHCDNPPCMLIEHLTIGTQRDNHDDAVERDRWHPTRGDRNNRSTMTIDKVRELRRLKGEGWTHSQLAENFGISKTSVASIAARERWGWVE